MLKLLLFFLLTSPVLAQENSIRWMRAPAPIVNNEIITTLCASENQRTVLATSFDGRWFYYSLLPGMPSILDPFDLSRGDGFCSVLDREDSEMLSGSSSILSWVPSTNTFNEFFNLSATPLFMDATKDGNMIAIFTEDNTLHLYDRVAGKEVMTWSNANGPVSFSPDGKLLLAAFKGNVSLIDVANRATIHTYTQYINPNNSEQADAVLFNPVQPGVFLIVADGLFEMDTAGNILAQYPGISTSIDGNDLTYSSDGSLVAVPGMLDSIEILNPSDQTHSEIFSPYGAHKLAFMGADTVVASASYDFSLYSASHESYIGSLDGHNWSVNGIAFSGDGNWLISASRDQSVIVWENASGIRKRKLYCPEDVRCVASSHDASTIIAANGYDSLWVWANNSDSAQILNVPSREVSTIFSTCFLPDDSTFVVAGDSLFEFNSKTLQILKRYDFGADVYCYSHDEKMLGIPDPYAENFDVWNRSTGLKITSFPLSGILLSAAFSDNDKKIILIIAFPNQFEIHNLVNDNPVIVPYDSAYWPAGMVMLPGDQLGAVPKDSGIQIFNVTTGKLVKTIVPPDNLGPYSTVSSIKVTSLTLYPITGDFATGEDDGSVIVWNALTGPASVMQAPPQQPQPLEAFATNSHIKINLPSGAASGRVFIYRTDGRCFFSSYVQMGESSVTTSELPSGVYFIVYEPSSGQRSFTKVSLFQ